MIIGSKIILRKKMVDDARDDYAWEIDPELAHLDAASPTTATFPQFLADYTDELDNHLSTRQRWAIDTPEGKHIGNCSYYNIRKIKGEAELGIMIGDRDYWNKGYGTDVVTTLVNHIFSQTNLNRIHLKTLESNPRAQKCFQKCGFTPYGHSARNGFSFVLMEIYRDQWQKYQPLL
ncbi:MAG: GNAT family N-acetyltransferase [Chloroflexi bacterium]|nr:GNAT family N-acetyltransferase [Chloroflexota bacterium]